MGAGTADAERAMGPRALWWMLVAALLVGGLVPSGYLLATWDDDAQRRLLLNPHHVFIPGMPSACRDGNDFVMAKKTADGRWVYRCGPGLGDLRVWPFAHTWASWTPPSHAGKSLDRAG